MWPEPGMTTNSTLVSGRAAHRRPQRGALVRISVHKQRRDVDPGQDLAQIRVRERVRHRPHARGAEVLHHIELGLNDLPRHLGREERLADVVVKARGQRPNCLSIFREGDHLLFRGEERLKVLTKDLKSVTARDGLLVLEFPGGPASFDSGRQRRSGRTRSSILRRAPANSGLSQVSPSAWSASSRRISWRNCAKSISLPTGRRPTSYSSPHRTAKRCRGRLNSPPCSIRPERCGLSIQREWGDLRDRSPRRRPRSRAQGHQGGVLLHPRRAPLRDSRRGAVGRLSTKTSAPGRGSECRPN